MYKMWNATLHCTQYSVNYLVKLNDVAFSLRENIPFVKFSKMAFINQFGRSRGTCIYTRLYFIYIPVGWTYCAILK